MDIFNKKKLEEADKKLKRMSNLIDEKNVEINRQDCSITRLENSNNELIYENKKLTDWIMKILDIVGTIEVKEKTAIEIPILLKKEYEIYNHNHLGIHETEIITIPEITIRIMK